MAEWERDGGERPVESSRRAVALFSADCPCCLARKRIRGKLCPRCGGRGWLLIGYDSVSESFEDWPYVEGLVLK